MVGTVAQTIMGEAGADPNAQFAVASTIFNRLHAGNFPGVSGGATGIVNAPNQFIGFSATPNASAQMFADAIENGTLSQFGSTGNATFFQTAGSNTTLGQNAGAVTIGGNNFSDAFGTPTASFQAPVFNGFGMSAGPVDNGNGSTAASNNVFAGGIPLTQGSEAQFFGSTPNFDPNAAPDVFSQVTGTGTSMGLPGSQIAAMQSSAAGTPEQIGLQPGLQNFLSGLTSGISNWTTRGFLIVVGLVIAVVGLVHLMDPGFKKTQAALATVAKA